MSKPQENALVGPPSGDHAESAAPGGQAYFSEEALRGIPWMVANKVLMLFVYMAISVLTVRLLGPVEYGRFVLVRSIAEYLVVVCALGLDVALLRFVPELVSTRNKAGLVRLVWRTFALQQATALVAIGTLLLAEPWLEKGFDMRFDGLLLPAGLLLAATVFKDAVNNLLTALFRTRTVALLSFANGLSWLFLLVGVLRFHPAASAALTVQVASLFVVYAIGMALVARLLRAMHWRSPPLGIGRQRTLRLSLPVMLNTLLRMMMLKYTEIFFLGVYFTPAIVGYYDLGYSTPMLVLTLIPAALQTLLTSAFAQAYTKDPQCLGRMIDSVYKLTMLIVLPLAAFGVFFAPRGIVLLYGADMAPAGVVAATFCILHILPLVSMPLSMAITVKEQVLRMLPYMVLQIAINLALDWLLIPRFGMGGAMAAVAGTFILTIPWRLRAVRGILGSISFPTGFFIRVLLCTAVLAGCLAPLARHLNLVTFFLLGVGYCLLYVVLLRLLRIIRPSDVADLRGLKLAKVNRLLDLLVGKGKI